MRSSEQTTGWDWVGDSIVQAEFLIISNLSGRGVASRGRDKRDRRQRRMWPVEVAAFWASSPL